MIIKLSDNVSGSDFKAAAKTAAESKAAETVRIGDEDVQAYKDSTIIVVPKDATKGSNELYYELLLHTLMYGDLEGFDKAAEDTEATTNLYYVYPEPEE